MAIPRYGYNPNFAKVTKLLRDKDGLPIGRAHNNPIMYTIMYEVDYKDGHKASLAANAIAENIFAQFDGEGNGHVLFEYIVGHRYDGTEVREQEAFITMCTVTKRHRESKNGVEVLVQWKDERTTWVTLEDMNSSYPVQMAEYAAHRRITCDPVFSWWIWNVLAKRNRITGKLN